MSVLRTEGSPQAHIDQIARIDSLIDLFTSDDRPTLLLDTRTCRIRFCNIAFDSLLQGTAASADLESWIDSICALATHHMRPRDPTHEPIYLGNFAHQKWLGKSLGPSILTVFCRWTPAPVAIEGDATMIDDEQPRGNDRRTETQNITDMYMGWLDPKDDPWMSFVRNYPFHETALGPVSGWHPQLRRAVQRMMVCPESRILYWGDQHAMVYNEAAVPILGKVHPCLGMPLLDTWGQVMYHQIDATIRAVVESGKAQQMRNIMFEMQRDGFLEQTWHHFYQLPITGPDGRYLGCVCEFAENTTAVMQENRAAILDTCIKSAANALSLDKLWSVSLDSFSKTSVDIAAGCVFSVSNIPDDSKSLSNPQDYHLSASFGLANTPTTISNSLLKILNHSFDCEKLVVLRQTDDSLPSDVQWSSVDRGALNTLCVLPIKDLNDRRLAVCVFGMNPGRPFDTGSRSFVSRIGDVLRKSAVFITLPEEQKRTEAITSALSDKLAIALLSAEMQEESYARMARTAPIGMYMLRPDGYPIFVNDAFLELHGVTRAQFYKSADEGLGWDPTVYEDDKEHVNQMWLDTINGTKPVQDEIRIAASTNRFPDGIRWVESMSYAVRDEAGDVTSVQGWLLDVSPRKMNERLVNEKLEDALENKRATETFLDMLSHEMRNPLSSILQLADGILSLLEDLPKPDTTEPLKDSAQTITLCARHMKTIIDEVLTFSKLDSNLLVLSLERARVPTIMETALKMFEKEIEHAKIVANMEVDQSYVDLGLNYVLVDPSRLLQVIINFLSNSIKFTKFEQQRRITIRLAASLTKPTEKDFGIAFLAPRKDLARDTSMPATPDTPAPEYALGDEVYIYIGVEDTGRGLTEDECKVLFQRFAQASPKTYKTYGGSGLGLFISRGLSELQGGQIGVRSTAGVGSTFAFFIKTRRAEPPRAASRTGSVVSTEALTDVQNLPHEKGRQDVQILTMSTVAEESVVSVKDLHVLLCEDNAINQKVIAQQLRRLGVHTVHTADDGLAALNFLATTTFASSSVLSSTPPTPLSIILMDVEMPVMDGLGAVRRIRQAEAKGDIKGHIPVIAITANARQEQIAVAMEAGMDEVVTKPFLVRELVSRMVALVQKFGGGGVGG